MKNYTRQGLGFDLQKIELYRFMNYHTPVKFDFRAPHIVISGPTGSGKTTILDALTFALFGRNSRLDLMGVKIEDICKKNGRVLCEFKSGYNHIRIRRGRDKRGKSYLELFINEIRYTGKIPEINEKIRSTILGMNYQSFVHSTIIRQDEMKALGSKSSAERLKTLQNLFRLDIFSKAITDTQRRLQDIINEKNQKKGTFETKQKELNKIEQIKTELSEIKPKLEITKKKHESLSKDIEILLKKEKEQRLIMEKYQSLQTTEKNAKIRLQDITKKISIAKTELENFKNFQAKLLQLETQTKEIEKLEKKIELLDNIRKKHELIENHIVVLENKKKKQEETLKKDLNKKLDKLRKEQERTKNLSTSIDHETAFKLLNQEGRLLERIQRISIEKTWNLSEKVIQGLKKEQIQARNDLKELQRDKKKINKDSFILSEIKHQITSLEEDIKELENRLKQEREIDDKELLDEKNKLKKLDFSAKKKQELKTFQEKHKSIRKIQIEFKKIKQEAKKQVDPTSKLTTISKERKVIKREIERVQDKLKEFPSFKKEYDKSLIEIENKKKEERNIDKTITLMREQIKNLTQKIKELKELKVEVQSLRKEIIILLKEEEILEKLKNEVFHTKGAPFYAIKKVLPRLGKRASLILSELTNNRFSQVQLQRIDTGKQGMGFEIRIKVPDGVRDVSTFSGGERTQINAALRLAISEELSELGQINGELIDSKKTLFIDEGDLGSLDTLEAQQTFVMKLFKLTKRFKIILITHLQEIADQFPHSINITRDNYGRSIKGEEAK